MNVALRGTCGLAQGDAYTDNFFSVLGVTPQYGPFFSAGEDRADASVAILSDRYWRNRFGSDPSIVGGAITINQIPFTVIGITLSEFSGIAVGSGPDVWVPLHALDRLKPDSKRWTAAFTSWMLIAGRLRPGVSALRAQAELDVIHRQLLAEQLWVSELRGSENMQRFVRESHLVLRTGARGAMSGMQDTYAFPLKLLMSVAGIVFLVACANVANLLLARASNRRREIAVRLALGAGRGRVVRQLLTESILLASIGGILAVPMAWRGSVALVRMISTGDLPRYPSTCIPTGGSSASPPQYPCSRGFCSAVIRRIFLRASGICTRHPDPARFPDPADLARRFCRRGSWGRRHSLPVDRKRGRLRRAIRAR